MRCVPTLVLVALTVLGSAAVPAAADRNPAVAVERAHTAFACDLYDALRSRKGNLFFSPHSISTALWMTREGAGGETAAEMDRVLHRPKGMDASWHAALIEQMQPGEIHERTGDGKKVSRPTFSLSVANAVWGADDVGFLKPFITTLATDYGAPLQQIDFRKTAAARERINRWVAEHTNEKIPEIVPEGDPSPDTKMMLANAVHFIAKWRTAFAKHITRDGTFHAPGSRDVTVPFMRRAGQFHHGETATAQFVELAFKGDDSAMLVVLPRGEGNLADLEAALSAETFHGWVAALKGKRVDLRLPRFTVRNSMDLAETLVGMGMERAFDAKRADFTGMTAEVPLFIGFVLHQSYVKVDESGVEAAAATVVGMKAGGRPPAPDVEFKADRPFLFVIRHTGTGEILFMGRVTDPTAG